MRTKSKLLAVASACVLGCTAPVQTYCDTPTAKPWIDNALGRLKSIGMSLRVAAHEGESSIEHLLACSNQHDRAELHVSAEQVLGTVRKWTSLQEGDLITAAYQKNVAPVNPAGTTTLQKLGSAFETWCMPAEKWQLAKLFYWCPERGKGSYSFPVAWTKRPDLYGDMVVFLQMDGSCLYLPSSEFKKCLDAATDWVLPEKIPLDKVHTKLKSGAVEDRIFAIRVLGIKKDPQHIELISSSLKDGDFDVRIAGIWALGMVGSTNGIQVLKSALDDKEGVRRAIAEALGRIGGEDTVSTLEMLLQDKSALVRRTGAKAMGESQSPKGVDALVKVLADSDQPTRQAALESLRKLGWKPVR